MTGIPSSSALASFEPAPGPATTKSVFLETDPAGLPPADAAAKLFYLLTEARHGKISGIHLKDESGQTIVYRLVMPEDANADAGLISTASPIGRSLLNKEEGDEVVVKTPNGGERHFLVVKLVTIHDE